MQLNRSMKENLAIIGANVAVMSFLLIAGCYWFAFRQPHHHGYFYFVLCVLLLDLVVNYFALLRSATLNYQRNGTNHVR